MCQIGAGRASHDRTIFVIDTIKPYIALLLQNPAALYTIYKATRHKLKELNIMLVTAWK